MFRTAIAALVLGAAASTAFAASPKVSWSKTISIGPNLVKSIGPMPADGYSDRRWMHPMGCEYSRAGRPGEVIWYLIINTAKKGCPTYVVQRGFADVY